jgi:phosphodiesterase/alkaline phosphatase D-like protein
MNIPPNQEVNIALVAMVLNQSISSLYNSKWNETKNNNDQMKVTEAMIKPVKKSRIAFGSCNDQDMKNNLWDVIASRNPSAFIWGGDAIYAGTKKLSRGLKVPDVVVEYCR